MPTRGPTDSDIEFASTLDELHEIITKYSTTHSIILGGDFNATLHRSKGPIKRDKLLQAFLNEHHLFHAHVSTIRPSNRHEGTGASSLIDYWFSSSGYPHTTVGLPCALNLSDHVEVVYPTHLTIDNMDGPGSPKAPEPNGSMKPKIRWAKADLDLYSCILDEKLPLLLSITPSCDMDVDLLAATLNSILYSASLAASPKGRPQSKQRKKTLPVWNETISHVVEASKKAHRVWQMAGAPCDPSNPLVRRKMARKHMRQTIRQQSYLNTQEKYEEIMQAKVEDTKLFYRLVNKQRSCIKTATDVLHFDGKSFSSSVDVAGAFSEHFQQLATSSNNPLFDAEYENQVTFDRLLIESIALQQEETIEPVTLNEVNTIVKSFKSNKAQDPFGTLKACSTDFATGFNSSDE